MDHITNPALKTWDSLNAALTTANEDFCRLLLDAEKKGRNRLSFKRRIHSRLNKARADRERVELLKNLL